jgi:regulator of sirC expression with transglutaminase-like and TPR domain
MKYPEEVRADFQQMMRVPTRRSIRARALSSPPIRWVDRCGPRDARSKNGPSSCARVWIELEQSAKLARLRNFVFEDLGFAGDHRDYYSPSNSLLHEVMKRRRGVPLTLAIVFMELGWRIGIPFEGVGFPGHFLVRLTGEPGDLLLDPFTHGTSVHEDDCRRMLLDATGGQLEYSDRYTASVSKRAMIVRLLHNLKGAYLRAGDDVAALRAVERVLLLRPHDADEIRDRGLLLYRLHRYGDAFAALNAYLGAAPSAHDRDAIVKHLERLRELLSLLN